MHPILFNLGSFPIATYGVMIVIGMLLGMWLARRLGSRVGIPPEFFYDLVFILLISGFLGARVFFILTNWSEFLAHPLDLILSRGGFVFLGGFLTAVIAAVWFVRRRGYPVWTVADVLAPALVLAHAFGRIGCFFAGCCYGEFCLPGEVRHGIKALAVQYPLIYDAKGAPSELFNYAYNSQIQQGLIPSTATAPLPIVPVQLLECAGNLVICALLLLAWKRRKNAGAIMGLYLILYSILRFTLEFWRGDIERGMYFNNTISTSQLISIFTLLAGIAILFWRRGRGLEPIPASEPAPAAAEPLRKPATAVVAAKSRGKHR
jgi:phosphatidylglycerol:prolipoprotein diacylglycerol transferase